MNLLEKSISNRNIVSVYINTESGGRNFSWNATSPLDNKYFNMICIYSCNI